jgi:signal transduction histidine kinase
LPHISLFPVGAVLLALGLFVWRARPYSSINRWFAGFAISVACWVLGVGGLQSGTHLDGWARFTFAGASLIPATFLVFMRAYPTPSTWPRRLTLNLTLSAGSLIALLSLTTSLMVYDTTLTPDGLTRKTGLLYPIFSLYFVATFVAAIILFISKWRSARGIPRAQLQYLGAGIILSATGAVSVNLVLPFLTGRSTYSLVGPYFSLLLVAVIGHAIIRHRLMDLRLFISRGLAYAVAIAIASVITISVGRLWFPAWEAGSLLVNPDLVSVVVVVLIFLSSPAQRLFGRVVDPYLYRGRLDYGSALRGATRRLSRLMQPQELVGQLRELLGEALVPETFVMLVRPLDSREFETLSADTPINADLLALVAGVTMRPNPTVFVVNPVHEKTAVGRARHEALRAAGVEVVVTLGRRGHVLGAILLGPRRSGDAYFQNDLVFVESVAELVSIALENSLLYRQRIQVLEYSERLLESLDSAVVAIDVAGKITSFNPAAKELLGVSEADKGAILDVLPSEVGWALAMAITDPWLPRGVEVTISREPQGVLHVVLSTAVLHDDEGQVAGALVVVTDLSTIKALEKNQRRVEHLAIMARFYAGIAHEIRNPLAAISNFIAMLPDRFNDPEYRETAIRLLPMEVDRIVRLADRLRLMAPSEGGRLSVVAIPPLLSDIVTIHSPAAREQQVKLSLQCPGELPKILGDPGQLVQLFVNLLKNAMEAMPEGGTVVIEAEHVPSRGTLDHVTVRIVDEGGGISPSVRAKVFEPFFTTKPSGTGLGLSICREIADFHHARLTLVSRGAYARGAYGGGTIAEVEFPCVPPETAFP